MKTMAVGSANFPIERTRIKLENIKKDEIPVYKAYTQIANTQDFDIFVSRVNNYETPNAYTYIIKANKLLKAINTDISAKHIFTAPKDASVSYLYSKYSSAIGDLVRKIVDKSASVLSTINTMNVSQKNLNKLRHI